MLKQNKHLTAAMYFFLSLPFVFWGCKHNVSGGGGGGSSSQLIPLKVGNSWTYRYVYYDSNGDSTSGEDTNIIYDDTVYNKTKYYSSHPDWDDDWYGNKSDGYYHIEFFEDHVNGPYLLKKYPVKKGEIFVNDYGNTVKVISVNEKITVFGHQYTCVHYRMEYSESDYWRREDEYYAPKIGLVYQYVEYYSNGYMYGYKYELKSYTLK